MVWHWGDFDKVEIGVRGDAERIFDPHDAYLLTSRADQPDFRYADALVDARLSADGASLGCRRGCGRCPPDTAIEIPRHQQKALQKQGPVPTDRGLKLLRPPATCADQASGDACDRTAEPVWPTVGVALHLLYPASPGRSHRPV